MASDHDDVEDFGRHESENMLRNKTNSKYLDDVVEKSSLDYDEAVEMIERDKKIIDHASDGFLNSLDLSTHEKSLEKAAARTQAGTHNQGTSEQTLQVTALVESSKTLVKLNRSATASVHDSVMGPDSHASFEQARAADRKHVKDVLARGKRVFERELDGLGQDASQNSFKASEEVETHAKAIFAGHRKHNHGNGDVGRSLKYMEKGVKKMTKGLDSGM